MSTPGQQGPVVTDWLVAFVLALGLEMILYTVTGDEFSLAIFISSTAEILVAPFYPGLYLVYPTALVMMLTGLMVAGRKIASRKCRVTGLLAGFTLWMGLGLFTIIAWYP